MAKFLDLDTTQGVGGAGGSVIAIAPDYTILIDEIDASLSYIGYAVPSSSPSAAVWKIKKVTDDAITYASGTDAFDKIWNDRLSYTYS